MDSTKPAIRDAVEALFNVKVKKVNTLVSKGKTKMFRGRKGERKDTKKAVVTLGRRLDDRRNHRPLRPQPNSPAFEAGTRRHRSMALKKYKPTTPGQRGLVLIDRADLFKGRPVKKLTEGLTKKGGQEQHGAHHGAPDRRWLEKALPDRGFQAEEVGRARDRGADRIRPEPHGVHRPHQV